MTPLFQRLRRTLAGFGRDERDGPLPLFLYVLTVVTGMVDALSFLGLGEVFVANMTGNIVLLGFAAVDPEHLSVSAHLTALTAFLVGAAAGGRLGLRYGGRRAQLLAIAAPVKMACGVAAFAVSLPGLGVADSPLRYAVIALLAVSMGLQNAVVRRLAVAELTTTVLTGTLTSFAAESSLAGGSNPRALRRLTAVAVLGLGAALSAWVLRAGGMSAVLLMTLTLLASVGLGAFRLRAAAAAWNVPPPGR